MWCTFQSCSINGQVSKFLHWQSPKMSDFLIPTDFEVNLPRRPVARGQWLLKNGVPDEIVQVLKGKLTCLARDRSENNDAPKVEALRVQCHFGS